MPQDHSFLSQIQRNSVALISLVVAITSLGYNTWRNEQTEENRNIRIAGFQLMDHIVELQTVVFLARFESDEAGSAADTRGDYFNGWAHVLSIRDLSYSMPKNVRAETEELFKEWDDGFATIETDDESFKDIDGAIDKTKNVILETIMKLD